MEDRVLTAAEAAELAALAAALGLNPEAQHLAHERLCGRVLALAQADGRITERERADLSLIAEALEVELESVASVKQTTPAGELPTGSVVCFTGALECRLGGQPITRERTWALAERAGLVPAKTVTRKCDLLVIADPHSQSGKATRARELGVRVIAETAFWPMIGIEVN